MLLFQILQILFIESFTLWDNGVLFLFIVETSYSRSTVVSQRLTAKFNSWSVNSFIEIFHWMSVEWISVFSLE